MKRTMQTSLIALVFLSFFNFATSKFDIAKLTFETEVLDYGTVEQNSDGTRFFNFKNTGDEPLLITKVKTSCGCTVPAYSKEPIMPGKEGQLEINYDTKRLGNFTKTITVMSNAEEGNKILKIKGNVVAEK
ncbi:DUF1573 domain-containing protein [Winogradskyella maritima]|uniref:DUF1573 domain-containing protein n=1 Tax=Winogradskyella maritima TaxID=1517766 RepID=A0ABV8AIM8_9FLAO|nr:DUF1573 domain-containing protein [Winogradskyella maritima]